MNIFDPEGTWRAETAVRYAHFRERERRGLTIRPIEPTMSTGPGDERRDVRWHSYFRFEALLHRHLERPAYV
ncbi:MAG: hypothetical protein M0R74_03885 [Dehalococcoidia bacterium]|nr:hypothetical protein [Dehalococcoidia bacterium]